MSSGQLFVLAIIGMLLVGQIVKARYNAKLGVVEDEDGNQKTVRDPDADRMRDEIKMLKDRIQVLERIATDTHGASDVSRQIEALRDT